MTVQITKDTESRMQKSIEALRIELGKLRANRANPSLLEHIKVSYYGNDTPLNQIASVTVDGSRALLVTPWEKTMLAAVEKAIRTSDLGLNPATVGASIRVPLPSLTEERRKELIKVMRDEVEKAKVSIRNVRRDANTQLKDLLKDKQISEDEERRTQANIQKITDKYIAEVDKISATKEQDLLEV